MLSIKPFDGHLGATVTGVDTSNPLSASDLGQVLNAIGRHGLLRFPEQNLEPAQQKAFAAQFGKVPPISGHLGKFVAPGVPEINILTNETEDGNPLGATNAGVIWHTDMVHAQPPGFANVLYCLQVPERDGKILGGTEFVNLIAAYESLPDDVKTRLDGVKGVYTGENYLTVARDPLEKGTTGTDKRAPITQPVVLVHPLSGRKVLYCDFGHVDRLEGLGADDSDAMLTYLLEHLMKPEHQFVYSWTARDLVIWDNLRTLHRAVFDYGPDETRHMWRCQVQGDRVFNPAFVETALAEARTAA